MSALGGLVGSFPCKRKINIKKTNNIIPIIIGIRQYYSIHYFLMPNKPEKIINITPIQIKLTKGL